MARADGAAGAHVGRQVLDAELSRAARQDHGALEHVAELTNVPGPGVPEEQLGRSLGELGRRIRKVRVQLIHGPRDEVEDVLASPRAERRQVHRHDAQAVVEILAEASGAHLGHEVPRARRDDAHLGLPLAGVVRRTEGLALEHAQQAPLHREVEGRHFVEEERAALGDCERAELARRPRAVAGRAEQLDLEIRGTHARAAHLDEGPPGARAQRVDELGHLALPGPHLTEEEDRGPVTRGEHLDLMRELAHGGGVSEHARGARAASLADVAAHLLEARFLQCPVGSGGEMPHVHRLGQKILGAFTHGLDSKRDVAMSRDHDHHGLVVPETREHLEAIHVAESEVEEHEIGAHAHERLDAGFTGAGAHDVMPLTLEIGAEGARDARLVVDDENRRHHSSRSQRSMVSAAGGGTIGSSTLNVAPCPGAVCTVICPPCSRTMPSEMERPRPVPSPTGFVV